MTFLEFHHYGGKEQISGYVGFEMVQVDIGEVETSMPAVTGEEKGSLWG